MCDADAIELDGQCYEWARVSFPTEQGQYMVSLAVDGSNVPHVIKYPSPLAYARINGSSLEEQASIDADAKHANLAVDSTGQPHIAYFKDCGAWDASVLAYASRAAADGSWSSNTVCTATCDSSTGVGLALDSSDRAHLIFIGPAFTEVRHAVRNGPGWQYSTVLGGRPLYSMSLAIAVDQDDVPHVAFNTADAYLPPELNYARLQGSYWQLSVVDSVPWDDSAPDFTGVSIATNQENMPSISYDALGPTLNDQGLRLAQPDGSWWEATTIRAHPNLFEGSNLAIDSKGQPHICFSGPEENIPASFRGLFYARFDGSSWETFIIADETVLVGEDFFVLDSRDIPHIVFRKWRENTFVYVTLDQTPFK